MNPVRNSQYYTNWQSINLVNKFTNIIISKLNEMDIDFTIINKINF